MTSPKEPRLDEPEDRDWDKPDTWQDYYGIDRPQDLDTYYVD